MDFTGLIAIIGVMSISVERIVEILKNMIPFLASERKDEEHERIRKVLLHLLAAAAGTAVAYCAQGQIQPLLSNIFRNPGVIGLPGCVLIGFLTSGSSGFWNQSMSILEEIKKQKKVSKKS